MKKVLALLMMVSVASASAAGLTSTDRVFLANAVRGNNFEIEAAKLALRMSHNMSDKTYARMMIMDHQNLAANVKAAVQRADAGMMLPKTVTYKQADMLNMLRRSGRNFDMMYRNQMVASHKQTYNLFDKYSRTMYANNGLQMVIKGAKPTVLMHWNHALNLPRM